MKYNYRVLHNTLSTYIVYEYSLHSTLRDEIMAATAAQFMADATRINSTSTTDTSVVEDINLTKRQRDTAQYIADMILELRNMARAAKLFTVMVPLEYAYYEAFSMANQVVVPLIEIERLRKLEAAANESADALPEDY